MWGSGIVGFGQQRLVYPSGRELDWVLIAFAPRKKHVTLYIMGDLGEHAELLEKLGSPACGKSCLHLKPILPAHVPTIRKLVRASVRHRIRAGARPAAKSRQVTKRAPR